MVSKDSPVKVEHRGSPLGVELIRQMANKTSTVKSRKLQLIVNVKQRIAFFATSSKRKYQSSCPSINWSCLRAHTMLSGFSVGFCNNEEKVICYQLELGKITCDISTECSSCHQGESEEVQTNISHALLRTHVIGGQRSVRIAPPSLPPHHRGPATRDFQSSISVEVLL